jgi:hypothetical protein
MLIALLLVLGSAVALVSPVPAQDSTTTTGEQDNRIPGLVTYEIETAWHSRDPIAYEVQPPVGGDHHPIWQDCGFYLEPVPSEMAVHSLEHGAVWITYDPGLDDEQRALLEQIATENPYVLVSPYLDLPAPVVASAWGAQLHLDGADDTRLPLFLREFIGAGPEPGAACTGGRSRTISFPAGTPVATPEATPG